MTLAIESVPDVRKVTVSFERMSAKVDSDNCSDGVIGQISEALLAAGYGGTVVAIDDPSEL